MEYAKVIFSGHAIERMFERNVQIEDVKRTLDSGEIIASYPDDKPFPSYLILGFIDEKPLHVVVAQNDLDCHIITAYPPDPTIWYDDFKSRRQE